MKTRTLLTIGAIVIVLIGIAAGVYFLFFAGNKPTVSVTVPNPFSADGGTRTPTDTTTTGPIQGAGTVVAPHLIRITEGPVARGAVALATRPEITASGTPALSDTEVRYIERASGNVYSFTVHDRVLTRISNKTLPGVIRASWLSDGSRAYAQFLTNESGVDTVATYSLPATGGEGFFLESGLSSVGISGSSTVFTLLPNATGSVASIATALGSSVKTLFVSPLSEITLQAFGKQYLATTKPAASVSGYAFQVDGKTGAFTRLIGPFQGLQTLPDPTGKYVLFSYVSRGKVYTSVFDVVNRTSTQLPVTTLADKCAWIPNGTALYCGVPTAITGTLPDSWLQGASSFSDRLWKVDMDTRLATLVADPNQLANIVIDMVSLTFDPGVDVVVFTNKKDGSLWTYDF